MTLGLLNIELWTMLTMTRPAWLYIFVAQPNWDSDRKKEKIGQGTRGRGRWIRLRPVCPYLIAVETNYFIGRLVQRRSRCAAPFQYEPIADELARSWVQHIDNWCTLDRSMCMRVKLTRTSPTHEPTRAKGSIAWLIKCAGITGECAQGRPDKWKTLLTEVIWMITV